MIAGGPKTPGARAVRYLLSRRRHAIPCLSQALSAVDAGLPGSGPRPRFSDKADPRLLHGCFPAAPERYKNRRGAPPSSRVNPTAVLPLYGNDCCRHPSSGPYLQHAARRSPLRRSLGRQNAVSFFPAYRRKAGRGSREGGIVAAAWTSPGRGSSPAPLVCRIAFHAATPGPGSAGEHAP